MNQYVQFLKQYLEGKQINYEYADAKTVLDMLYYAYIAENPIEEQEISECFLALDSILSQLRLEENNRVFDITVQLCGKYAHNAFLAGIHVGTRLYSELSQ